MCLGMVKVVAKRISGPLRPFDHALPLSLDFVEIGEGAQKLFPVRQRSELSQIFVASHLTAAEPIARAWQLARLNPRGEVLHDYNRGIAALLVGPEDEILAWGLNSNSKNKTLHAEVNLVQDYFRRTGRKIPRGARIYSTHKPCKMCAGMIFENSEERKDAFVLYEVEETGGLSSATVLDRHGLNRKIISSSKAE